MQQLNGRRKAGRRSGCLDDDIEFSFARLRFRDRIRFDSATLSNGEFISMFADQGDFRATRCQNLSAKLAQLAIADYRDARVFGDGYALENSTGSRERLSEDSSLVRDLVRHRQ